MSDPAVLYGVAYLDWLTADFTILNIRLASDR